MILIIVPKLARSTIEVDTGGVARAGQPELIDGRNAISHRHFRHPHARQQGTAEKDQVDERSVYARSEADATPAR